MKVDKHESSLFHEWSVRTRGADKDILIAKLQVLNSTISSCLQTITMNIFGNSSNQCSLLSLFIHVDMFVLVLHSIYCCELLY